MTRVKRASLLPIVAIALAGIGYLACSTSEGERCLPEPSSDECAVGLSCVVPTNCVAAVCCPTDAPSSDPRCAPCPPAGAGGAGGGGAGDAGGAVGSGGGKDAGTD